MKRGFKKKKKETTHGLSSEEVFKSVVTERPPGRAGQEVRCYRGPPAISGATDEVHTVQLWSQIFSTEVPRPGNGGLNDPWRGERQGHPPCSQGSRFDLLQRVFIEFLPYVRPRAGCWGRWA